MKNLFIVLGLVITLSFIALILSLTALTLACWPQAVYFVKAEFVVFAVSCFSFVITLVLIPHRRRN